LRRVFSCFNGTYILVRFFFFDESLFEWRGYFTAGKARNGVEDVLFFSFFMNLTDVLEISDAMCSFTTVIDCTTLLREHSWWQRVTGNNT
jgi:hypothetical protein